MLKTIKHRKKDKMTKHMNINACSIVYDDVRYWVDYSFKIVKTTDKNGKKDEGIELVTTFFKNGEEIHRVYNCGNFETAIRLANRGYARLTAIRMIESANKSVHSPFKKH